MRTDGGEDVYEGDRMKWYKFARKKPLNKKGKSDSEKAKARAWRAFSDYIRLRDCLLTTGTKHECLCITCGRRKEYAEIDAGHFVPGRRNSVLFSEFGVHGQCRFCNRYKDGDYPKYREVMIARHGLEEIERYEILAKVSVKLYTSDFERIYTHYKQEYEKLTEGK